MQLWKWYTWKILTWWFLSSSTKCFVYRILGLSRISWLLRVLFRLFIVVYSSTKRKDKTVKGNEDNKEHDDEICGAQLSLSWFVFRRKSPGAREATSASKKHTNQNDQNKSECLFVSGRNFIVASTRSVRHSLWRFWCPKSEWTLTFENMDTDFAKVSVRKVSVYPYTYTLVCYVLALIPVASLAGPRTAGTVLYWLYSQVYGLGNNWRTCFVLPPRGAIFNASLFKGSTKPGSKYRSLPINLRGKDLIL
jgi:hypothetical protein